MAVAPAHMNPVLALHAYLCASAAALGVLAWVVGQRAVDTYTFAAELTLGLHFSVFVNFAVAALAAAALVCVRLLFGAPLPTELELLRDTLPYYALHLLSLTISDGGVPNIALAAVAMLLKACHVLATERLDRLQTRVGNVLPDARLRRAAIARTLLLDLHVGVAALLLAVDFLLAKLLVLDVFRGLPLMGSLLFGVQFARLAFDLATYCSKFLLNVHEMVWYRLRNDADGDECVWEGKPVCTLTVDLAAAALTLCFYAGFAYMLAAHAGTLPTLTVLHDTAQAAWRVFKAARAFATYLSHARHLHLHLAAASAAHLDHAGRLCIICREEMRLPQEAAAHGRALAPRRVPKRLHCGHILHLGCLKDWLERLANCPLCRRPVFARADPPLQPPDPDVPADWAVFEKNGSTVRLPAEATLAVAPAEPSPVYALVTLPPDPDDDPDPDKWLGVHDLTNNE